MSASSFFSLSSLYLSSYQMAEKAGGGAGRLRLSSGKPKY
jgi:hypothetical protein